MDDLSVRFHVKASFSVTLGLYAGKVDKAMLADNIDQLIQDAGGIEMFIDEHTIEGITTDNGECLAGTP